MSDPHTRTKSEMSDTVNLTLTSADGERSVTYEINRDANTPPRRHTMTADGPLYGKFHVTRTDGKSAPGEKHERCEYFVLDLSHDQHAAAAVAAYADSCESTHPTLAADLRNRYVEGNQASA